MEIIANIFIIAGVGAATFYCFVLSRRLKQFTSLEGGMGAAVARLSAQVEELNTSLKKAQHIADKAQNQVSGQTQRAEEATRKLELMLASMHDLDFSGAAPEEERMRQW